MIDSNDQNRSERDKEEGKKVQRDRQSESNTIIITNLPKIFQENETFQYNLRSHFESYGKMINYLNLINLNRILIVFEDLESARRAKLEMDRFEIVIDKKIDRKTDGLSSNGHNDFDGEEEGEESDLNEEEKELLKDLPRKTIFRVYYGPNATNLAEIQSTENFSKLVDSERDLGDDHQDIDEEQQQQQQDRLKPPMSDKNFLISPPGSPPVGWEQIREDAPNTRTLADDLFQRLRFLSSNQEGEDSDEEDSKEDEDGEDDENCKREEEDQDRSFSAEEIEILAEEPIKNLPGLTVQRTERNGKRPGMKIELVKATIDSMISGSGAENGNLNFGNSGVGNRISPTPRPTFT